MEQHGGGPIISRAGFHLAILCHGYDVDTLQSVLRSMGIFKSRHALWSVFEKFERLISHDFITIIYQQYPLSMREGIAIAALDNQWRIVQG